MPLGQPYDPGRPATLADHYDPLKVEAQHEAVMDKILSLKRELETKTGLAQFMGIAPQHADPQTGQVNVLSALSSDQGKAWANKYPELAYNVMDKAGMITGGGKVTNMGESVKEYLAGTGRDMSNPQGEKAGYAFFATPEGQKDWKQFNIDKKISTGSEGALEAVLHDKNSTPEQKESAKAALKDKIEQAKNKAIVVQTATGGSPIDQAKEIGDAIMRGEQPPIISGFGMAKIAGPLKSYLAKQGYNLKNAELDYRATEKHLATLNGTQQTKLRQAVTFASDSLSLVENLAKEWEGGGFPLLNKARLAAAKSGALGTKAQEIATQLETQISDLTSELGTVYKGGNSSTDESLKLAAKNLSADWSVPQLLSNVKLIRQNLTIRTNSINSTGVAGLSDSAAEPPKKEEPSKQTEGVTPSGYKFKVVQ